MLEMLGLALGDTMTGQVLFIETLDNEKFCGVIGEPKRPQVTCVEFSALKDVYVRIKGRGEPWGLEDYAFLPLRVAAGIGTATVIAGGGS